MHDHQVEYLDALRASTTDLVEELSALPWSGADVAAPSLCEGWTRGHVLTHIARNADGITRTLTGALHGELLERYPGGSPARDAAIDAGASRPYEELVADVRDSGARLDAAFTAVADAGGWLLPTEHGDPAREWIYRRWREVEVHHVDLAGPYTPDRWPRLLVATLLPEEVERMTGRSDRALWLRVDAAGSVAPELVGLEWLVGEGDPVEVRGPDWAVLAWLAGRPSVAAGALTAAPALSEWR